MHRDHNRACVVSWSLSNEPETDPEGEPGALAYFKQLLAFARGQDSQRRPITVEGASDPSFYKALDLDLISIHSYPGWCARACPATFSLCKHADQLDAA